MSVQARRYLIRGHVQGVGFRRYVEKHACALELTGWTRNLDDGRVEVYVAGDSGKLSQLAALLYKGPAWSEVRGVEELEAAHEYHAGFRVR